MDYKKLNINSEVLLQLTNEGAKLLAANFNKWMLDSSKHRTASYYIGKCDTNGYYPMQLHQVISVFGDHLCVGCHLAFETNILIKETDLTDNVK